MFTVIIPVYATEEETVFIGYSDFNTTTETWQTLSTTYNETWEVEIYIAFYLNTSESSGQASIVLSSDTSKTNAINLQFYVSNNVLKVWYVESGTGICIGNGTWAYDDTVKVIMYDDGLSVIDSEGNEVLDHAPVENFDLAVIGTKGSSTTIARSGYASVRVSELKITTSFMPLIMAVATVMIALTVIKAVGKSIKV